MTALLVRVFTNLGFGGAVLSARDTRVSGLVQCPLVVVKRTFVGLSEMSAYDKLFLVFVFYDCYDRQKPINLAVLHLSH